MEGYNKNHPIGELSDKCITLINANNRIGLKEIKLPDKILVFVDWSYYRFKTLIKNNVTAISNQ